MKILKYATLTLAIFLQVSCSESKNDGTSTKELSQSLNPYEIKGMSIQLPKKPKPKSINLPPQAKATVEVFNAFEVSKAPTAINISHVISKSDFNIEGSINGSISQVKAQSGVSSFNSSKEEFTVNGLPGRKAKITYNRGGYSITQYVWVCAKNREWWQVQIIGTKDNDQDLDDLSEKIFSSIEIQ